MKGRTPIQVFPVPNVYTNSFVISSCMHNMHIVCKWFVIAQKKINTECILCWGLNKETNKETKKETKKQRHSMNFKKAVATALA